MCQFGAMGMAEAGYTYDQIFRFYYRGAGIHRYY
jgi:peptidoglycan hydrolase-like amidase